MKTSSIIVILFTAILAGCEKPSHKTTQSPAHHSKIVEVTVLDSYPEGLAEFPIDHLNAVMEEWTEVDHAHFYYESPEANIKFPYQDGHFVSSDSREGSWRYYHCAGLRIRWGDQPFRYFLPSDVATPIINTSKRSEPNETRQSTAIWTQIEFRLATAGASTLTYAKKTITHP